MRVLGIQLVVKSRDRDAAVERFSALLNADPLEQFDLQGGALTVTVLAGISVVSGPKDALDGAQLPQATVFVSSLEETGQVLQRTGWTTEGSLGSGSSLQARDPDGLRFEFVERQ